MLCHATDDKPSAIKFYLNGRGAKEEGEAKEEEGEANLLQLSRARRSKTKPNQGGARVFYIFIEICVPKYGFIRPLGYVFRKVCIFAHRIAGETMHDEEDSFCRNRNCLIL